MLVSSVTACLTVLGVDFDARLRGGGDAGADASSDAGTGADAGDAQEAVVGQGALAVAPDHVCAIRGNGALACWGTRSPALGLGPGSARVDTPTTVAGIAGTVTSVVTSALATCAVADEVASCWGASFDANPARDVPAVKSMLPATRSMAVSPFAGHACALATDGSVRCWGDNTRAQLGTFETSDSSASTPLLSDVRADGRALSLGATFSCGLVEETVRCWGDNTYAVLGRTYAMLSLSADGRELTFAGRHRGNVAVSAGDDFVCALASDGAVWCWGSHFDGALGLEGTRVAAERTSKYIETPLEIAELGEPMVAIAAGGHHVCALGRSRKVRCWGANNRGQLGAPTAASTSDVPVVVVGLQGVRDLAGAERRSCARTDDGAVYCWGAGVDESARVDGGAAGDSVTPVLVGRP